MPSGKTMKSIVVSLVFPLLMFFPGYFVGRSISDNELVMLLFAVLSMSLGFCIAALFFRNRKKEYTPYVIRKDE